MTTTAFILPFHGVQPQLAGPLRAAGAGSAIIGRATLGRDLSLGEDCVIRADGQEVHIGDDVWLGDRSTVHIVHDILPCIIGSHVTVGANSVVHACTVADHCVIEDDVSVLDDAKVEENVLIEAGSTVFPRKVLQSGFVYAGSPAHPVRPLADGELAERGARLRAGSRPGTSLPPGPRDFGEQVFIAVTAQTAGQLDFAPGSSLFFSCVADAGSGTIRVGANTNIQDNTIIRAGAGAVVIGPDVTVGHNVYIPAARIGARSLVGMGAVLAEGTVIQDDVLLAAGATTEAAQVLESGWLWAGRPAKALTRLDDSRRAVMAETVTTYCGYARTFRAAQQEIV